MSVKLDGHVVLLRSNPAALDIYSSDAVHVHSVTLQSFIQEPLHALGTASGTFIISHGMRNDSSHRIVEVTSDGDCLRYYGEQCGAGEGQLNYPAQLALDSEEKRIYVIDLINNRVLVLNRSLNRCEILLDFGQSAEKPCRLFYDSDTRELLVGLNTGRIKVYSVI